MAHLGYLSEPTIHDNSIVFVCEDDLWIISDEGGTASRLTVGRGKCSLPKFSPDGKMIAFVGREEGHQEVYVVPKEGGLARRVTYLGGDTCVVCGWSPDGKEIIFTSDAGSPFVRHTEAFAVRPEGGPVRALDLGHVKTISITRNGKTVIGRNNMDPAQWKRYRGGTAGDLWIDRDGKGRFRRLLTTPGNHVWPMWIGDRVYFLSDYQGLGNIYSCSADGADVRRHTDSANYYVRYPSTDGRRIVYAAGGEIYVFDARRIAARK